MKDSKENRWSAYLSDILDLAYWLEFVEVGTSWRTCNTPSLSIVTSSEGDAAWVKSKMKTKRKVES